LSLQVYVIFDSKAVIVDFDTVFYDFMFRYFRSKLFV